MVASETEGEPMNDYSAHTYTKPDPNCGDCKGRGVRTYESDGVSLAARVNGGTPVPERLFVRCQCTDLRPTTELERVFRREIDS